MSEYQLVNFFGGPGAGKGTQVFKLADTFPFTILGMSSMIKRFITQYDTPKSAHFDRVQNIKSKFASGELVDFEDVKVVMGDDISRLLLDGQKLLFEGFPRTHEQAMWFASFLEEMKIKTLFVHLKIDLNVVLDRVKNRYWIEGSDQPFASYSDALSACKNGQKPFQRELDTDLEVTKKRYAIQYADFKDGVLQAMNACKYVTVVTIQADQTPDAVFADITKAYQQI